MGAFDWFKKSDDQQMTDTHAEILGGDASISTATPSTGGDVAAPAITAAREAATAALQSPGKRRGRPPKNPALGGGNSPASPASSDASNISPELRAEIARQMESVFEPRAWGSLLACPGDVALAFTGKERWKVSEEERKTLGACGSTFARTLAITNPKALAAFMLGSALFAVYVPRATAELRDMLQAKKQKASDKPAEKTV